MVTTTEEQLRGQLAAMRKSVETARFVLGGKKNIIAKQPAACTYNATLALENLRTALSTDFGKPEADAITAAVEETEAEGANTDAHVALNRIRDKRKPSTAEYRRCDRSRERELDARTARREAVERMHKG